MAEVAENPLGQFEQPQTEQRFLRHVDKLKACNAKSMMKQVGANRILIVEDEALLALELQETLEQAGFLVVGVTPTCRTAIEWAERQLPDLVLMDICLAGRRDGIEAAMILRRDFRIPSLFLTGIHTGALQDRCAKALPVGFLTKPVVKGTLVRAVCSALDHPGLGA